MRRRGGGFEFGEVSTRSERGERGREEEERRQRHVTFVFGSGDEKITWRRAALRHYDT